MRFKIQHQPPTIPAGARALDPCQLSLGNHVRVIVVEESDLPGPGATAAARSLDGGYVIVGEGGVGRVMRRPPRALDEVAGDEHRAGC